MRCRRHQSLARATWLRLERGGTGVVEEGEEEPLTRLVLLLSSLEQSVEIIATKVENMIVVAGDNSDRLRACFRKDLDGF